MTLVGPARVHGLFGQRPKQKKNLTWFLPIKVDDYLPRYLVIIVGGTEDAGVRPWLLLRRYTKVGMYVEYGMKRGLAKL